MGNEFDNAEDRKLSTMYVGQIVDIADPKKLGRVRVRIPAVADPTGWAYPIGWPGAGGKKLGMWSVPPKGAEVAVFFNMGDPDRPYYIAGNFGEGEAPDEVDEGSVDDATKVPFVFNGNRWKLILDERSGKQRCALEDKKTGDVIEIDGVKGGVHLKATSAVSIECTGAIDIRGIAVTINGRIVAPSAKPI